MKARDQLFKLHNKPYKPSATVKIVFQYYDLAFKTDGKGRPVLLFIGK